MTCDEQTAAAKLIKSCKVGDFLYFDSEGRARNNTNRPGAVGKVIIRGFKRGRRGYVRVELKIDSTGGHHALWSDSLHDYAVIRRATVFEVHQWCRENGEEIPAKKRKVRGPNKAKSTSAAPNAGNSDSEKLLREEIERLRAAAAHAVTQAQIAQANERVWRNRYEVNAAKVSNYSGGSLKITADIMQFLRFSGIGQFPCSADQLKKGRAAMALKLHPDSTQRDSNEQFCAAMRGYEALAKLA
jgi:hypothetical protein